MGVVKDISGERFTRLVVVGRAGLNKHGKALWLCTCDCGKQRTLTGNALRRGNTRSCGCLQVEESRARFLKHGHAPGTTDTPTYRSWRAMIDRCTNVNSTAYADYGGAGVIVCADWRNFENFLRDMGERPPGKTLDREDNAGNYTPANCRWATRTEQNRNRAIPYRFSLDDAQRMLAMRAAGHTYREIGDAFSVAPGTAHDVVRRMQALQ